MRPGAREDRLVVLGLNGVGVVVEGSASASAAREGVDELAAVLVHAPACLDCEDRCLRVL